ncbi:MAG TPA: rhodanese-like domain-containing protein [Candidatus Dormibacteraeota bacterium]|nr:rhodanese-like domain-containing protein [Candidatus Dormibacteraeota bacterium]
MPSLVFWASEVKGLLEQGAQLVDVLSEDDFEHDHLPGAINIPLKRLDAKTTAALDRDRTVLVYCNDFG